jgi:hypothetical protein
VSALNPRPDQNGLLTEIFAPIPHSPTLCRWALNEAGFHPSQHYAFRGWDHPWDTRSVFDRLTIWFPPPEIAAQLLYFLLQCHVEKPLTTTACVVLPRVIQKKWSRPSKYVVEVGTYQRAVAPFAHRSLFTIPVVVLFIPLHVRSFPQPRLDPAPTTALRQYHRQQAALVRGVLEAFEQD